MKLLGRPAERHVAHCHEERNVHYYYHQLDCFQSIAGNHQLRNLVVVDARVLCNARVLFYLFFVALLDSLLDPVESSRDVKDFDALNRSAHLDGIEKVRELEAHENPGEWQKGHEVE